MTKKLLALLLCVAIGADAQVMRGPAAHSSQVLTGKALMILSTQIALFSGSETNLFGTDAHNNTEAATQTIATEQVTFSGLSARIVSGNDASSATLLFRNNGANGNNTITISGADVGTDTTHSDTVSSSNTFNLAYTDTGPNSIFSWMKANVEFASGYGNFHGSANFAGIVFDLASTTSYIPLAGALSPDGNTTRVNTEFINRAYTSIEAIQVYLPANNARNNDTTIQTYIDGSAGGLTVTIPAQPGGTIGRYTSTGTVDALTSGQKVTLGITTGSGVEDLTIGSVLVTFKSTIGKSESIWGALGGFARTASATPNYIPPGGRQTLSLTSSPFTEAQAAVVPGFAARISNLRQYVGTNTTTGDQTITLYKNGSATGLIITITAGADDQWFEDTTNTVDINSTDSISIEIVGGSSGTCQFWNGAITFTLL